MHANHWTRCREEFNHISAALADISGGRTTARVASGLAALELVRLGAQINAVMARIEQLMTGLRYFSAHLAYEIRTPPRAIHSDVERLARMGNPYSRRRIEAMIHKTIDQKDARLQNVMRLVRLRAGERVEMRDGVGLGALVEEQVIHLRDLLESGGRNLAVSLTLGVLIRCNPQLMEVLVINLLSSPAKYSLPGARIELEPTVECRPGEGSRFRMPIGNFGGRFPEAPRGAAFARFTRAEGQGRWRVSDSVRASRSSSAEITPVAASQWA